MQIPCRSFRKVSLPGSLIHAVSRLLILSLFKMLVFALHGFLGGGGISFDFLKKCIKTSFTLMTEVFGDLLHFVLDVDASPISFQPQLCPSNPANAQSLLEASHQSKPFVRVTSLKAVRRVTATPS